MNTVYDPGISVLLSLYEGSEAEEFVQCLASIETQTLAPEEIVMVFDGPVSDAIKTVADQFESTSSITVKRLEFARNRGLGSALADGAKACSQSLVARVDTDDVSEPDRFEVQHAALVADAELDVIGGWLAEIDPATGGKKIRKVPDSHARIVLFSKFRNPFNHPTVMLRRDRLIQAGNYQPMLWFEDYYLWARMIVRNFRFANLNRVLVTATADANYFQRRGGMDYFREERRLARRFRRVGFHNRAQSALFYATRTLFRLSPNKARSWLYRRALRR